jgi:hypothetical protein
MKLYPENEVLPTWSDQSTNKNKAHSYSLNSQSVEQTEKETMWNMKALHNYNNKSISL